MVPHERDGAHVQMHVSPSVPIDRRITVEAGSDGLLVVIQRRKARSFSLSLDEAAYLHGLLGAQLPPVTVRTIGAGG